MSTDKIEHYRVGELVIETGSGWWAIAAAETIIKH